MVDTMNANFSKIGKSWVYYIPSHITYMGNFHVFNYYNVEAFTYHILLELYVSYDTMDVMTYFTFMRLYSICKVWYICTHNI